jgi:hypothetical protein
MANDLKGVLLKKAIGSKATYDFFLEHTWPSMLP